MLKKHNTKFVAHVIQSERIVPFSTFGTILYKALFLKRIVLFGEKNSSILEKVLLFFSFFEKNYSFFAWNYSFVRWNYSFIRWNFFFNGTILFFDGTILFSVFLYGKFFFRPYNKYGLGSASKCVKTT